MFWAKDLYIYNESDTALTELLTNSTFEIDVNIAGVPQAIPSDLVVSGDTMFRMVNFSGQLYGIGSVERKNAFCMHYVWFL